MSQRSTEFEHTSKFRRLRFAQLTAFGTGHGRLGVRRTSATSGEQLHLVTGDQRNGAILSESEVRALRDSLTGWLRLLGRQRAARRNTTTKGTP